MKILLSTLILLAQAPSSAPGPALERKCDDDCVAILVEAIEWMMKKEGVPVAPGKSIPGTAIAATNPRVLVDIQPSVSLRAEGAVDEAEEVAALRQAAQRLELETVRRSEHAASQHCSVRPVGCECFSAYGTAIINAENIRFLSSEEAVLSAKVTFLGQPFDGKVAHGYQLPLKKLKGEWTALRPEYIIFIH